MSGPTQLSVPELVSIIANLPPGSALERSMARAAGRPAADDWWRAAQLRLTHSLIDITLQVWTGGKVTAAPLRKMLDVDEAASQPAEPEKPRTFREWFAALGVWTEGVPPPPERS